MKTMLATKIVFILVLLMLFSPILSAADEIAEMSFDTIWTACEGEPSGYEKLQRKEIDVFLQLSPRYLHVCPFFS